MHQLTRASLAVAVTALVALAAAPTAHAGWMTGNGNPPVYTTDAPCRNGMQWSYATFLANGLLQGSVNLNFHAISIDAIGTVPRDPPDPQWVVSWRPTLTIPQRRLTLPSSFTMIGASLFPRRVNEFDYSADLTFSFNRTLAPLTPLRMQWHDPRSPLTALYAGARYRVANCWIATVLGPRELAVLSAGDIKPSSVAAQFSGIKHYVEDVDGDGDDDLVLVFDEDDAPRREPGARIVLFPSLGVM